MKFQFVLVSINQARIRHLYLDGRLLARDLTQRTLYAAEEHA